jgi:hypothetical protein
MPIFKYPLQHRAKSTVTMPTGAKILSLGVQPNMDAGVDEFKVWASVPDNAELSTVDVKFVLVGTGGDAPKGFTFLGTLILNGGTLVLHAFFDSSAPVSKA